MSDLLSIGKSGLGAARKSLETTGHNIANVNTEGYSRQRVHLQTNTPTVKDGMISGTGTLMRSIDRVHDKYIEARLQQVTSESKYYDERAGRLENIENIFNEVDTEGLNKVINKFYNSFRELANQPENETMRSVVRDTAALVVKDFQRIRSTLDGMARTIDKQLAGEVEDINSILKNIATLNKKIAAIEASGDSTGDLRDQRDQQVLELSKSFRVNTYIDGKGNFNVAAKNVGTLVTAGNFVQLDSSGTHKENSSNNMDGTVEVFFKGRPAHSVTPKFRSGAVSSMIRARNEDIRKLQDDIDQIAFEFINTTNALHRRGFVNRLVETDEAGNPVAYDMKGPTTGINFFEEPLQQENAALHIELSQDVKNDLSNIATGLLPNSAGDNRVAVAISKLQHERVMKGGTATIEETYLQTIGNIGLEAGKAKLDKEQSEGIRVQTEQLKARTSGVSIDEETANMVKFQHMYEASAKVMQTADEMFKTVLAIKR